MVSSKVKRKFAKSRKKAWQFTDIKNVENFHESELLKERLGGLTEKPNEELFFTETDTLDDNKKRKAIPRLNVKQRKLKALEPPKCHEGLVNTSKVPDPVIKRNVVKTAEDRKSKMQKDLEEKFRQQGFLTKKETIAKQDRLLHKARVKALLKPVDFDKDLWGDEEEHKNEDQPKDWLQEDTTRHYVANTGQLTVRVPHSIQKKPSLLPSIELPHPGTSYNPSKTDHKYLLKAVADKELKMIKHEKHLYKVTTEMFKKITRKEMMNNWLEEMSQGLGINSEDENEEDTGDYKPANPPALLKIKPLRKKKKALLLKREKVEKARQKIEKQKTADLHKLKSFKKEISKLEEKSSKLKQKRKEMRIKDLSKTKRIGRNKFSEPLLVFKRAHELQKNLRNLDVEGSILSDRFFSFQRRNVLEPRRIVSKKHAKVKRFKKPGFKAEDIEKSYKNLKV